MPRFVITARDGTDTDVQLDESFFSIGRAPSCTIQIKDRTLSKRHSKFFRTRYGYYVVDVGSRNGTMVNGKRISEHLLKPGDQIVLGKIRIRWIGDPPAEPKRSAEVGPLEVEEYHVVREEARTRPAPLAKKPAARAAVSVEEAEEIRLVRVDAERSAPPPPVRWADDAPALPPILEDLPFEGDVLPPLAVPAAPLRAPLPFLEAADDEAASLDAIDVVLGRLRREREAEATRLERWSLLAVRVVQVARSRGGRPAAIGAAVVGATLFLVLSARYAADSRWREPEGLLLAPSPASRSAVGAGEGDALRDALSQARTLEDVDLDQARRVLRSFLSSHPQTARRAEVEAELDRLERRAAAGAAKDRSARVAFARDARARGDLLLALEANRLRERTETDPQEASKFVKEAQEIESALRDRYRGERRTLADHARAGDVRSARTERDRLVRAYPLPDLIEDANRLVDEAVAAAARPVEPDPPPRVEVPRPEPPLGEAALCRRVREHLGAMRHPEALALAEEARPRLDGTPLAPLASLVRSEIWLVEAVRREVQRRRTGVLPAGSLPAGISGVLVGLEDEGLSIRPASGAVRRVAWKDLDDRAIYAVLRQNLTPPIQPETYLALAAFCALRDWETEMARNIQFAGVTDPAAKEKGRTVREFHHAYALQLAKKE